MTDCNMDKCEKIWLKDVGIVSERLNGIDRALNVQAAELERRMHESNNLKKEFGHALSLVESRVLKLETRSVVWITVIGAIFALLQIVLRYVK